MMNFNNCPAAVALAIVACLTSGTLGDDELTNSTEKPIVSWSGSDSHVQKQQILRILTERDWIDVWLEHTGEQGHAADYDTWRNEAGVPSVDFSRYMVIAIFDGQGFNCAGLTDATIKQSAKELIFRFDFKSYGGTDDGGDTISPYGLYVVTKSRKAITLQFPEPGPKDAAPSGNWEIYGRIAGEK